MDRDINFIFDEEWEEQEKELYQIINEIGDPKLHKNVYILNTLMRAAAFNWVKKKPMLEYNKFQILGDEIKKTKYYQKVINIPAGMEVLPVPTPSSETKIQPLQVFKEIPRYIQKTITEPIRKPKRKRKRPSLITEQHVTSSRDLITDRITKKVLAGVDVGEEYVLHEPRLDEIDIKVLKKVKEKHFDNMEKGWQLIQKYSEKFKIEPGHDSLIKYYVVNDVFGFGRIEALLHDKNVEEFYCDGPLKKVVVQLMDKKLNSNIIFNQEDLKNLIFGLAERLDLKIKKDEPTVRGETRGFEFILTADKANNKFNFSVKRI